jgi:hypothetical protein
MDKKFVLFYSVQTHPHPYPKGTLPSGKEAGTKY